MAIAEEEGIDTIEEMKEFVKRIKEYGTSLNPNFIVSTKIYRYLP